MNNKIEFSNPEMLTNEDLKAIALLTGFDLPKELKAFFLKYAGATIRMGTKTCFFDIIYPHGWRTDDGLTNVESPNSIAKKWQSRNYLNEFKQFFEIQDNYVEPDKLFPILATCSGGQIYVAIGGQHDGKIFHVDTGDAGFCFMANSLEAFLLQCYPLNEEE